MTDALAHRLVPDELWGVVAPLIPPVRGRPQGGGRPRIDDRAAFTAITFVLSSGCSWRNVPMTFGVKPATLHRRFLEWHAAGLWSALHVEVVRELGDGSEARWVRRLHECVLTRGAQAPGQGRVSRQSAPVDDMKDIKRVTHAVSKTRGQGAPT